MRIKQTVIVIFKILLIVFLVISFNLIMMPKYINENPDGRIVPEMYSENGDPEVVFVGSSTVYSGVSPVLMYEAYGIRSYVCASSSQTPWNSYYMLKEALKRFNPKLVVLDIGFFTVEDTYAEEVSNRKLFDYMRWSPDKYNGILAAKAEDEEINSYVFPVLRYHERYKELSIDDFKYAYYKPKVTYNGYIMSALMSQSLPEKVTMDEIEGVYLSDKSRKYLIDIINLCQTKGIAIMLMKTPSYNAKWGWDFENAIEGVAKENKISYVNYDVVTDSLIDFMTESPDEGGHLNIFGAEKFSYILGADLSTNYELTTDKEDSKLSAIWDEKVNRYENAKVELYTSMN